MGNQVCGESLPTTGSDTVWIAGLAATLLAYGLFAVGLAWYFRQKDGVTKVTK